MSIETIESIVVTIVVSIMFIGTIALISIFGDDDGPDVYC